MDTTKEYIKMSEKAFGKEEPEGSAVEYSFRTIITEHGYWYDGNNKEGYVPLKTQDQLQKMALEHLKQKYPVYDNGKIVGYNYDIIDLQWDFSNFFAGIYSETYLKTLEQMWLVFVMSSVFKKVWDGKEWIKSGDELNEST